MPGIACAYLADYRRNWPDVYAEAPTLDALAQRLGMDAPTLQRSVEADPSSSPNACRPALAEAPLLKGHGHHLAWAFASGRRAGRFAAEAARGALQ